MWITVLGIAVSAFAAMDMTVPRENGNTSIDAQGSLKSLLRIWDIYALPQKVKTMSKHMEQHTGGGQADIHNQNGCPTVKRLNSIMNEMDFLNEVEQLYHFLKALEKGTLRNVGATLLDGEKYAKHREDMLMRWIGHHKTSSHTNYEANCKRRSRLTRILEYSLLQHMLNLVNLPKERNWPSGRNFINRTETK